MLTKNERKKFRKIFRRSVGDRIVELSDANSKSVHKEFPPESLRNYLPPRVKKVPRLTAWSSKQLRHPNWVTKFRKRIGDNLFAKAKYLKSLNKDPETQRIFEAMARRFTIGTTFLFPPHF